MPTIRVHSYQTDPEAGFSLIEVLACVALLAIGISVAIGAVAAVARGNATATRRDVALMTARNVIARARAVAAFYPDASTTYLSDRTTWALRASSSYSTTAAIPQPGAPQATLPLDISTTFSNGTGTDYSGTFRVNVSYPISADSNAAKQSVTLSERLAPSGFSQATTIVLPADEPRRLAN